MNPFTPAPVEQAPLSEAQNVFTSPTYVPEAAPAPAPAPTAPVAYEQAVQAPAPAPQQQAVDQIPSGNVFDLFKIDDDAPASSDSDDPFSPAQK